MKPILCPCGFEKELIKGIAVCTKHCDQLCPNRNGCNICGIYSVAVNQRVTAEHAKERANG